MTFLILDNWPESSKLSLLKAFDSDILDVWGFTVSRQGNFGILRIDLESSQLDN